MALPLNVTARVVPTFPASVTGQTGIDITKQNGGFLIGLDLDDFGSAQGSILYRNATAYTSLPPGTSGQVLVSGGAAANPSWANTSVADGSITFAKIQDIATDKLLGRDTAGSGSVEEIGVGGGIEFDGSQALQRSALTGDVTATAGSNATSIADEAVTFAKMQHIATDKLLGRGTAATGDVEEITLGTNLSLTGTTLNATGGGGGTARQLLNGGYFATNPWLRGTSFDAASTPANNDDSYLADQFVLLSDGNDIVDVAKDTDGSLLSTVQTINKQFGYVTMLEAPNCAELIGNDVSVMVSAKGSGLATLRIAVLAWTGTADSVTSDVVTTWAGGGVEPTWATNWTREGTITDLTLTGSFTTAKVEAATIDTASAKQVAVVVWLDDTDGAVSDTLNIEYVSMVAGATHPDDVPTKSISQEAADCLRYYRRINQAANSGWPLLLGVVGGATFARFQQAMTPHMRAIPTPGLVNLVLNDFSTNFTVGAITNMCTTDNIALQIASTGMTGGVPIQLAADGTSPGSYLELSSEL